MPILSRVLYCHDYCSNIVNLEVKVVETSNFVSFCFAVLGPLLFYINFRINLSIFTKKFYLNFLGLC